MGKDTWMKAVNAHTKMRLRIAQTEEQRRREALWETALEGWRQFFDSDEVHAAKQLLQCTGNALPLYGYDLPESDKGLRHIVFVFTAHEGVKKASFHAPEPCSEVWQSHALPALESQDFQVVPCSSADLIRSMKEHGRSEGVLQALQSMYRVLDQMADTLLRQIERTLHDLDQEEQRVGGRSS